MAKAASQCQDGADQINQIRRTLSDQVSGLVSTGSWQGNAADAFRRAHEGFDGQFQTVLKELQDIHESLTVSQQDYTSTEQDQESATNAILSMIGE